MDHGGSMTNTTCLSSMLFNTYTTDACFLTESWHVTTPGTFVATCIGACLLSVVLEALRQSARRYDAYVLSQLAALNTANDFKPITRRATALQQAVRSVLWAVTFGLAYIIMLLVMSYNVYVLVSVVVGVGFGKFFCDWLVLDGETAVKRDECTTVCCS